MQELLFYAMKMTGCSLVLLLYYYLFLLNKMFHQYNRFYLLMSAVISFAFPLIKIPVFWEISDGHPPLFIETLRAITITNRINGQASSFLSHPSTILIAIYLAVALFMLGRLLIALFRIKRLSLRYPSQQLDKITLYHTAEDDAPFSFMTKIFWNDNIAIDSPAGRRIFNHELFHARQLHSVDNVAMEIMLSLAWFNPFFHIIRKEIAAVHEFMADRFAAEGSDRYAYAEYMITHAAKQTSATTIAHHFFNSLFKRRIAMILQHSKSKFSYARRLLAIPLVIFIFCSLSMRASQQVAGGSAVNDSKTDTTGPVSKPEKDAQYPGGPLAWQQYLLKTLHYPQQAQDKEVQGAVVVEFIVEKDGSTRDFKAISGPEEGGLREESIRVLQNSGHWLPGKDKGEVATTVKRQPIIFRLEKQ